MEAAVLASAAGGIVGLVIFLGLSALNFFAIRQIIMKAGYSRNWIVVPLTPVLLVMVTFIVQIVDLNNAVRNGTALTFGSNLGNLKILVGLDLLTAFGAWVFFLIFSFSAWPVSSQARQLRPVASVRRKPSAPAGQTPPGVPPRLSANPFDPELVQAMTNARGVSAPSMTMTRPRTTLQTADPPAVIHCSWCGKQREVDAPAIHHCGPLDRPAVYCMDCGTPLRDGATKCGTCGTPATKVSKH